MRELAKACTYERFVQILKKYRMIYDMQDGEWIDFTWTIGRYEFDSCVGYDYDGTPHLSDCISYYNPEEDEDEDCDYFFPDMIYFKSS